FSISERCSSFSTTDVTRPSMLRRPVHGSTSTRSATRITMSRSELMTVNFTSIQAVLSPSMRRLDGTLTADARPRARATGGLLALSAAAPASAADGLHLVLTPSQKPTDLLATGEEFAKALTKLSGIPVRVTVASDYAAVIEALRNRTADLAFVHPVGYVLASREAKATIMVRNLWHGKSSFTSRIYVRRESGLKTLEDLRGKTMAFIDPASSSGYTYPMVLLIQRGLVKDRDPKSFFREVLFAGAHDAGMRALLNGHVDALASFDMAREQYLKDPAERERIIY